MSDTVTFSKPEPDASPAYACSGRVSRRYVRWYALCLVLSVGIGILYQWTLTFVLNEKIICFICLTASGLTGVLVLLSGVFGNCRNRLVGLGCGALAALLMVLASHWFMYHRVCTGQSISFLDYLNSRVVRGLISTGRGSKVKVVSGVLVWWLWAIEAFVAMCIAGGMAYSAAGEPFCERCGLWANKTLAKTTFSASADAFVALNAARDGDTVVETLIAAANDPAASKGTIEIELNTCAICGGVRTLTMELKKGASWKLARRLKRPLFLGKDAAEKFREFAAETSV